MADYPYTPTPASVKRFLEHVQSAGVPPKVTQKYLEQVGFKSTNDRYIIGVLKFIDFLDTGGVPTKTWQAYRPKSTAPAVLGTAIRRGYAELFTTYPDAHRKDNEALRNFFSAHTKVAGTTLGRIVDTFKALCSVASFDDGASLPAPTEPEEKEEESAVRSTSPRKTLVRSQPPAESASGPSVAINIQLQLPATSDADIYDKLFAALKKHLL